MCIESARDRLAAGRGDQYTCCGAGATKAGNDVATVTHGSRRRPRVLYWNNIPSPYTVDRLNAVMRRGKVDLEVWFDQRTEPDRSWTVDESRWLFPHRYLSRVGLGDRQLSVPTGLFALRGPALLVSLYAGPSYVVAQRLAALRGWRTAIISLATFDSWSARRRWKEGLKRFVFSRADGILTSGEDGRAFAARYGAQPERIHIVRPVTDSVFYSQAAGAAREERERIRAQWRLSGTVFIYVGRLWSGKGIRSLLEAYRSVAADAPGRTTLLMLGDGPEEAAIRTMALTGGPGRVVLAGFHQQQELPRFYAAADVFVFPTRGDPYGLVVDEAMAAGLPIVSTTAAGEIRERVREGVNGYLVPPDDPLALAQAMSRFVTGDANPSKMGAHSLEMIAPYTLDQWAMGFERFVQATLGSARRGPI